ncbi:MAG: alpha-galactosidase [Verrucomicrobia bacterium]|nr:alpha-galactosidase [Verrucomicrobiota bacterium]
MNNVIRILTLLGFSAGTVSLATNDVSTEVSRAANWVQEKFRGDSPTPPISFTHGGEPSSKILKLWKSNRGSQALDENRVQHTITFKDPNSGLVLRSVAVEYRDFPVVEWTVYFTNTAKTNSPILQDIQALDVGFEDLGGGDMTLHHFKGSPAEVDDYRPRATRLSLKSRVRITAAGGRPSGSDLPYFNVAGSESGVILAVGWPGQWAAQFSREEKGLRIWAGQELTHFYLQPGEQIRGPLVALQFWRGDWLNAQNAWRRWMIAHNLPRPGGKLPAPQLAGCSSQQFGEMINANEGNQKLFIDRYLEEGLKIDYWWMDAGWYKNDGTWLNTGTWEVDKKRFPNGLRAITDHAHAKGIKNIVWFEPERVTEGTWLFENHPEWLLTPPTFTGAKEYIMHKRLLNLGNPEALHWLIEHIDQIIKHEGIDLYRQDLNTDLDYFWHHNDAPDRQGITENHYVTGYLAYWDELRRRHPNMLIDSCASGGRRNDLETLRRAVPLLRSDYVFEPIGEQCHTYGISFWFPYHGTGTLIGPSKLANIPDDKVDPYVFRSDMAASVTACWDVRRKDLDYARLRKLTRELRQVGPCYLGDYYPLTPYSTSNDVWMAWQFDRPDRNQGMIQVFRRGESSYESARFKLHGLQPDRKYSFTDFDNAGQTETTGRELMDGGLKVQINDQPGAVVIMYKKID